MDLGFRDEPPGAGSRRIAVGLVDEALATLAPAASGARTDLPARTGSRPDKAVHDARKRCKETRALLRLVRPALAEHDYRAQNDLVRDASRILSPIRDAHALLETFDALVAVDAHAATTPLGGVRAGLARAARAATTSVHDGDDRIVAAVGLLGDARDRIAGWSVPDDPAVLLDGVAKIHRQAVDGLEASRRDGDPHAFHDWRKRVKYLWYHLQVLRRIAPDLLDPLASTHKSLSDALGDAHDLHVLVDTVEADPDAHGGPVAVAAVRALAATRREDLERRAVNLGARLHAETTDAFVDRLGRWWAATDDVGAAVQVGGIDDVAPVADDLADVTTGELRRRARAADVAGRSAMTKAELVHAVRAATAGSAGPRRRGTTESCAS